MLKCLDGGGRMRSRRLSADLFRIVSRISYVSPSSNWWNSTISGSTTNTSVGSIAAPTLFRSVPSRLDGTSGCRGLRRYACLRRIPAMTRSSRSLCPGVIRRPSSLSRSSASRFLRSHSSALNTSRRGYSGMDRFSLSLARTRSFSVGSMYLGSRVSSKNSIVDGGAALALNFRSLSSISVRGSNRPTPSTRSLSRSRSCGSRGIRAFLWSIVYSESLSSMRARSSSSAAAVRSSRYRSSSSICSTCVAVWRTRGWGQFAGFGRGTGGTFDRPRDAVAAGEAGRASRGDALAPEF